jgi:hypothetical protein
MSKVKSQIRKYKAQGLIEAVLAIAIAGIACLIFLDISSHSIIEIDDITKSDQLIKTSSNTAAQVRRIAELQNNNTNPDVKLFPDPSTKVGQCFAITGDVQQPVFVNITGSACTESTIDTCRSGVYTADNIFSVYCIETTSGNLVMGKVYSGLKTCQTLKNTNNCRVADSHYAVGVYIYKNIRISCGNTICDSANGETTLTCPKDCH